MRSTILTYGKSRQQLAKAKTVFYRYIAIATYLDSIVWAQAESIILCVLSDFRT